MQRKRAVINPLGGVYVNDIKARCSEASSIILDMKEHIAETKKLASPKNKEKPQKPQEAGTTESTVKHKGNDGTCDAR